MSWFSYYDNEYMPWISIGISGYLTDDMYFTIPKLATKHNYKRKRRLVLQLLISRWTLQLEIPYKHVGVTLRKGNRDLD